jgi:Protein of unknown function (DUF3990)
VAEGVDVFAGRAEVDFGQGFYTTTSLEQSQTWARFKSYRMNEPPAVVQLTLDCLELRNLRSLVFARDESSDDYWRFVEHCRRGSQVPALTAEDYDVVYGPVALRWGPDEYGIKPGLNQISFHGVRAQQLLRDARVCTLEVLP